MGFTTQTFIFVFFPLCFAAYYLIALLQYKGILSKLLNKIRATDLVLIGINFSFYIWACFDDLFRFIVYILIIYILGFFIYYVRKSGFSIILTQKENPENKRYLSIALPILCIAILFAIYVLFHFKYTDMFIQVLNFFFKDNLTGKSIIAPLGISFITFSSVSYLADIYLEKADAGNLIDCTLYLTFFPKVVSGPIVLWRDFRGQINERKINLTGISNGISRIMIGFAKKLILADTFGACIASINSAIDTSTAYGIALLYMLQIYYDFSGYSDIAIGLSNMLGFSIKENFNFPYLSCSISEFWRRWHISLGTWFREYIYFPLGGSRAGKSRTILNIGIVFLLTGIWHGAGWTYMLWGIINGLCNILEKLLKENKVYKKTPILLKWFVTMIITFFCWELFRFESFSSCLNWFKVMFGITNFTNIPYTWQYYFDKQIVSLMIIAIFGATIWGLPSIQNAYQKVIKTKLGYLFNELIIIVLFVIAMMFMVNSNYSPFIYFQY